MKDKITAAHKPCHVLNSVMTSPMFISVIKCSVTLWNLYGDLKVLLGYWGKPELTGPTQELNLAIPS